MRIVEKVARGEKNAWNGKMSDWDYDKVTKMWDAISPEFKRSIAKQRGRNRFAYSTVCRNMTDANAFDNPRNKEMKEKRQKQATVVCSSFRITRLSLS